MDFTPYKLVMHATNPGISMFFFPFLLFSFSSMGEKGRYQVLKKLELRSNRFKNQPIE
jgi:hypothetical protein